MVSRKHVTATPRGSLENRLQNHSSSPEIRNEQPMTEEALYKIVEFMITNLGLFEQLGRYFKQNGKEKAESSN